MLGHFLLSLSLGSGFRALARIHFFYFRMAFVAQPPFVRFPFDGYLPASRAPFLISFHFNTSFARQSLG